MRHQFRMIEHLRLPDHLIDGAEAEGGHDLADFLGEEEEIVDDGRRGAGEPLAQYSVSGGGTDRAGVEMALAHRDAGGGDERRGRHAELNGPEEGADDDVAAGQEAT